MSPKVKIKPRMDEGTTLKMGNALGPCSNLLGVLLFPDSKANLLIKSLPGSHLLVQIQGNVPSKAGERNFIHEAAVAQWSKVTPRACTALGERECKERRGGGAPRSQSAEKEQLAKKTKFRWSKKQENQGRGALWKPKKFTLIAPGRCKQVRPLGGA